MEIKEIVNKEEWEGFLSHCAEKTFLQSWNWADFCSQMGDKVWRLGVYNGGILISVSLVSKISARRGTFLFIPHGPAVLDGLTIQDKKEVLDLLLTHLRLISKSENASFIRIAPTFLRGPESEEIFSNLGFREAPIHMHPEVTWELDITLSEDELLKNMRKTTRYLIRQAERNSDVQVDISSRLEDLKLFWPVYLETARRHSFVVFPEKYLEEEFNSFIKDRGILLFLGRYKNEVVSAAIFVFWQNTCFYHHSGSLSKYSKIPVSYLLQWEAIKEARRKGCRTYNFWGIAPAVNSESDAQRSKHPWAGLSLFKMGFGGYKKEYVKTQDLVIAKKYWLNYLIERLRKFKRNL